VVKVVFRNVLEMIVDRIDKGKDKTNSDNDIDNGEDFAPICLRREISIANSG